MIPHVKYHCEIQRDVCQRLSTWFAIIKIQDRNYNCHYINLIGTHISKQIIAIYLTA